MAEEIPDNLEGCLRDPNYIEAQELLALDVKALKDNELPSELNDLQFLLCKNAERANIEVLLASKCERRKIVDMHICLEGRPRYRFERNGDYYTKVLTNPFHPENQIASEAQIVEFDSTISRKYIERLSENHQRAILRYAFAYRLDGLHLAYENAINKSGYLLKVLESIELLHQLYERVMSTSVRKI